jgi:acyl-CoA synthetase (NDP forming)
MNIARPGLDTDPQARRRANLRRLLSPRHVAFVGGQSVVEPINLCRKAGFSGEIWAVNPKHRELAGAPCFATVADLPAAPDATFIGVPREITVDIVRQLAARGAGGCVAYAAGFAEVGEGDLQASLVEAAALEALARGVPIVALKSGTSAVGAELTVTHTGSLSGSDALYDALFDRLGVTRVDSVPQLLETVKLLGVAGAPDGNRLCAFTCSGGDSLLVADAASRVGVDMPAMSPGQADAVRAQLPDFASVMNPLDYNVTLWGDRDALTRCFSTVLAEGYDAGMLVIDFPQNDPEGYASCEAAIDAAIATRRATGRPMLVTSSLPELLPRSARDRLHESGVPAMQGIDEALGAVAAAARFGEQRHLLAGRAGALELPPVTALRAGREIVGERESKQILAGHGLQVPEARLAAAEDAPSIAEALSFPVALKLASPVVAHKTEAGAVRIGLASAGEVSAAVAEMRRSLARFDPPVAPELFLVERMAPAPVAELIVGVTRDPQFGLALVVGAGGVLVEMVKDSATLLLPTDRDAVARALAGLKVAKLIAGYRGRPAGDMAAAIDAVMAVAAFAEDARDRLIELDVNPLFVLPEGQGVVAVDALIVRAV